MSTERGQGELVEVLAAARCRDVHAERWDLKYGTGTCNACLSWGDTFAPAIQAHVDAEVAAALEGAAVDLDRAARLQVAPMASNAYNIAARIVREQIPTSGGGA